MRINEKRQQSCVTRSLCPLRVSLSRFHLNRAKDKGRICGNFDEIATCTVTRYSISAIRATLLSNAFLSRDGALTKALVKVINDDEIARGREEIRAIQPRTPLRGFINCHRRVICPLALALAKGTATWSIARSTYLIAAFIRTVMSRSFNEAAIRRDCAPMIYGGAIRFQPFCRALHVLEDYRRKKYLFFFPPSLSLSLSFLF